MGFEDLAQRFGEGGDAVEFEAFDSFIGTGFVEVRRVDGFERFRGRQVCLGGGKFGFAGFAESSGAEFAAESAFWGVDDVEEGLEDGCEFTDYSQKLEE